MHNREATSKERILSVGIILLTLFLSFSQCAVSPLYITVANMASSFETEAFFLELNIETEETRNVTTYPFDPTYNRALWGGVIHYESAIFYGLYQTVTSRTSSLMAINTTSGEKLFMDLEMPGVVWSIAIDQTSGLLHFINFTVPLDFPYHTKGLRGDWSTYDTKTGEFQLLKAGITNNSEVASTSASAYNSETKKLYVLPYQYLTSYMLVQYSLSEPYYSEFEISHRNFSATEYKQMAINPKTNELYIIGFEMYDTDNPTIILNLVNQNSLKNGTFESSIVCTYSYDEPIISFNANPYTADIDYISNSIVFGEAVTVRNSITSSNYIWVSNIDDCSSALMSYKQSKPQTISTPRFLPPSQ